jgi:hypothetical protein
LVIGARFLDDSTQQLQPFTEVLDFKVAAGYFFHTPGLIT